MGLVFGANRSEHQTDEEGPQVTKSVEELQSDLFNLMEEEIRKKIQTLLDQHRIMTVATLRPDGWPQATTVGHV